MRLNRELAGVILDKALKGPSFNLSSQAIREFDLIRQTLSGNAVIALFDAPWTPIYILVCFIVHPLLGTFTLAGAVILGMLAWWGERASQGPLEAANDVAKRAYVSYDQSIAASGVIRALGMRRAMVARQLRQRDSMIALQAEASFSAGSYVTAARFVRISLQSLVIGLAALLAIDDQISGGAIFASSFLAARALAPVEQIIGSSRSFVQARSAYRLLSEMLAGPPQISVTELPAPQGALRVEQLAVLNPQRDKAILQNVSFALEPGDTVAVIGPSGAGKSTLMKAIVGAVPLERGAVRFDGADRDDWDPERLARYIGYLPQEPSLVEGTVKENIARFRSELDEGAVDSQVVEAAVAAGAHDLVLRLTAGYDYPLGWAGLGISAGQAQRIALARALFGAPRVVLLDEPNAHLDSEGDAQLMKTISDLRAQRVTVLVVTHRPSILPVVEKVLFMRDGRVEAFGPREEVLRRITANQPSRPLPEAAARKA
jgi:ATP-binding cassette subfamily C protein